MIEAIYTGTIYSGPALFGGPAFMAAFALITVWSLFLLLRIQIRRCWVRFLGCLFLAFTLSSLLGITQTSMLDPTFFHGGELGNWIFMNCKLTHTLGFVLFLSWLGFIGSTLLATDWLFHEYITYALGLGAQTGPDTRLRTRQAPSSRSKRSLSKPRKTLLKQAAFGQGNQIGLFPENQGVKVLEKGPPPSKDREEDDSGMLWGRGRTRAAEKTLSATGSEPGVHQRVPDRAMPDPRAEEGAISVHPVAHNPVIETENQPATDSTDHPENESECDSVDSDDVPAAENHDGDERERSGDYEYEEVGDEAEDERDGVETDEYEEYEYEEVEVKEDGDEDDADSDDEDGEYEYEEVEVEEDGDEDDTDSDDEDEEYEYVEVEDEEDSEGSDDTTNAEEEEQSVTEPPAQSGTARDRTSAAKESPEEAWAMEVTETLPDPATARTGNEETPPTSSAEGSAIKEEGGPVRGIPIKPESLNGGPLPTNEWWVAPAGYKRKQK